MTAPVPDVLVALVRDPARAALLLDFDGTLAEIVARPELARPVDGAADAVRAVTARFGAVAVISGRPTEEVRELLGVEGVRYLGLYGLEESGGDDGVPAAVEAVARSAARVVSGASVELKGGSVALHYRQADDPVAARDALVAALREPPAGFEVIEGKMVLELVPAGRPRKDGAVRRLVEKLRPAAVLYAGDDLADLEAFAELGRLTSTSGLHTVRVAVMGPETPPALAEASDVRVDGPAGMVRLLAEITSAAGP